MTRTCSAAIALCWFFFELPQVVIGQSNAPTTPTKGTTPVVCGRNPYAEPKANRAPISLAPYIR